MSMVIGKNYVKPIDKDVALAEEITKAWFEGRCPEIEGGSLASVHSNPQYILSSYIEYALTTVRKEAREAAFKESIAIIVGQPIEHYIYSGAQPMAAGTFRDNAVKAIETTVAIEAAKNQRAAANTEEGSNHATKV